MINNLAGASVVVAILLTSACSEAPQTKPEAKAAPAAPVSGQIAFWEMYKSAHTWAKDALPLTLKSKELSGIKNEAGKFGQWTATFGSPSQREVQTFTYSVAAVAPDIAKGVNESHALPWRGPTQEVMPFDTYDFSVDSDAAYKTASAKAETWLKAHPGEEASLILGNATRFKRPVWAVLWGDEKTGYLVLVDSKSGKIVK